MVVLKLHVTLCLLFQSIQPFACNIWHPYWQRALQQTWTDGLGQSNLYPTVPDQWCTETNHTLRACFQGTFSYYSFRDVHLCHLILFQTSILDSVRFSDDTSDWKCSSCPDQWETNKQCMQIMFWKHFQLLQFHVISKPISGLNFFTFLAISNSIWCNLLNLHLNFRTFWLLGCIFWYQHLQKQVYYQATNKLNFALKFT